MINPFKEVNWTPDRAQRKSFAASLVIGFPCLAALLLLVLRIFSGQWNLSLPLWIGGVGAAIGAVLWLAPSIARPFYVVWFAFACSIGIVISNTLMAAFYYTVITGIGLARRIMGRGGLRKRFDKSAATYWKDAEPAPRPERYYRQF